MPDLEQIGDRAKQACASNSNVDQQVKSAVQQAHEELSQLKRQLH